MVNSILSNFLFFPAVSLRDSQVTVTRLKEIRDQIRRKSLPSLFTFGFRKILKFHQQTFYPFYFVQKVSFTEAERGKEESHFADSDPFAQKDEVSTLHPPRLHSPNFFLEKQVRRSVNLTFPFPSPEGQSFLF